MRAKNLFLSKNRQRPSLCLGLTVHKIDKNSSKTLWVISKISAVIKILLTKIAESKVVNHAVEHPDPLKIRRRGRGTCFAPSAYKRKHSFIQNCCSIALQVSHHQGWKTCVKNWKVKLFFRGAWNSLMAWPDWPRPLIFYDRSTPQPRFTSWFGSSPKSNHLLLFMYCEKKITSKSVDYFAEISC